jgi:ParB/RepB/Spo0J family partition protein
VPIEITPDNVIICGHRRAEAAKSLGWQEIDAIVREDLADQGDAAVEERLINDNLHRRHLDPISQARCYERLLDLAKAQGLTRSNLPADLRGPRRDVIGRKLGISGRTLDRYLRVLKTPLAVQNAVSEGQVSIKAAGDIANLSTKLQQKLAHEVKQGKPVDQVVKAYLTDPKNRKRGNTNRRYKFAGDVLHQFLHHVRRTHFELHDRVLEIHHLSASEMEWLGKGKALIEQLLEQADKQATSAPEDGDD